MRPSEILRELKKYPRKVLGQNFLVDEKVIRDMVEAAELSEADTVVEIGPGLGALTYALLEHAGRVLAIEADAVFASYLRLKDVPNLQVITGDALKVDWTAHLRQKAIRQPADKNQEDKIESKISPAEGESYKIVASIPYSITSPLLRKIFGLRNKPEVAVLLVQKEMAERIVAKPDSSERGFLTVLVEANAVAKIVRYIKPGSFYPRPKVESAIVELALRPKSLADQIFWPAVEAGFRHKRQTLANALAKSLSLDKSRVITALKAAKINPSWRAQVLTIEQWIQLSRKIQPQK